MLALLLNQRLRGRDAARTVLFTPSALSPRHNPQAGSLTKVRRTDAFPRTIPGDANR
jgi:hypothetical protein